MGKSSDDCMKSEYFTSEAHTPVYWRLTNQELDQAGKGYSEEERARNRSYPRHVDVLWHAMIGLGKAENIGQILKNWESEKQRFTAGEHYFDEDLSHAMYSDQYEVAKLLVESEALAQFCARKDDSFHSHVLIFDPTEILIAVGCGRNYFELLLRAKENHASAMGTSFALVDNNVTLRDFAEAIGDKDTLRVMMDYYSRHLECTQGKMAKDLIRTLETHFRQLGKAGLAKIVHDYSTTWKNKHVVL